MIIIALYTLCSVPLSKLFPLWLRVMEPEEGDCSIAPSGLDMTLALFPPEKDKALKKPDPAPG